MDTDHVLPDEPAPRTRAPLWRRWRYLLSFCLPVPMSSTFLRSVSRAAIERGACGNHFEGDSHTDMVCARWWQFRGRTWRQRTVTFCVPR